MAKIAMWITAGPGLEAKALAGVRLATRLRETGRAETEVFFFGPGVELLDVSEGELRKALDGLRPAGVPVSACVNNAKNLGAEDRLKAYGVDLLPATEVVARLTDEGYQIIGY